MKPTHIEHLGIAVKSLETAIPYVENIFGLKCYAIEEVPEQKVKQPFSRSDKLKSNCWSRPTPKGP